MRVVDDPRIQNEQHERGRPRVQLCAVRGNSGDDLHRHERIEHRRRRFGAATPGCSDLSLGLVGGRLRPAPAALEALLSARTVDPRDLTAIDWELGAFCCRQCEQNYCATCWHPWPVFDDDGSMWFEEYRGRCPDGHEQRLQD